MEGLDSVNLESTGPPTRRLVHHTNTQKVVEVDARPVKRQNTVRQRRHELIGQLLNVNITQAQFAHDSLV